jgi:hypothetical protein
MPQNQDQQQCETYGGRTEQRTQEKLQSKGDTD